VLADDEQADEQAAGLFDQALGADLGRWPSSAAALSAGATPRQR
jgi:hypothetical protein